MSFWRGDIVEEKEFSRKVSEAGGRAYLVGGCVRDALMSRAVCDMDYVVCGVSDFSFCDIFPEAMRVGKAFPVFLLNIDGKTCEVALARREYKISSGYRGFEPVFSPSVTIEEDLYRRDLTINSIALDISSGRFIDPYNGVSDIKNKIIRAVSHHFSEDPVRALRAARFASSLGFYVEPKTLKQMSLCADELALEPKERVVSEMSKALSSAKPSRFFKVLKESGLLKTVFPQIYDLIGKTQPKEHHPEGDAFCHTMEMVDDAAKLNDRTEIRFAALMHDIGKGRTPLEMLPRHIDHDKRGLSVLADIALELPLPKRWIRCAEFAAAEHMRAKSLTLYPKIADLLRRLSRHPIGFDGFSAVIMADNKGRLPDYLKNYEKYLSAMKVAREKAEIPKNLTGCQIGDWIREREIDAIKELKI